MATEHALVVIPADSDDREYDGGAMAKLTGRKRKFVIAMMQQGVNPKACRKAAAEAGLTPDYGWKLMRDPDILAALREEATKRMAGAALVGVNVMLEIAQTPGHKQQYQAAKDLAAINGYTSEQRIVVEHIDADSRKQIQQIREMAQQLGMDPKQLIEAAGIIDAEFEDVTVTNIPQVDTSDW